MCGICLSSVADPVRVLEAARLRSQISRLAFQRRKTQIVDPAERKLTVLLRRIFRREAERVLQLMGGMSLPPGQVRQPALERQVNSTDDILRTLQYGIDLTPYEFALAEGYQEVMPSAMMALCEQLASRSVGVSGDLMRFPQAQAWIQQHKIVFSKRYAQLVSDRTNLLIRKTLSAGWEAGEGMESLIRRVERVYAESAGPRSEMIARTESSRAYNSAQIEMGEQLGATRKFWISSGSPYAMVDVCGENDALGPIPISGSFHDIDGNPIDAPPAHVNCLCDIGYEFPEDLQVPPELTEV